MFKEIVEESKVFSIPENIKTTDVIQHNDIDSLEKFAKKRKFFLDYDKNFIDVGLKNKLSKISEFGYKSISFEKMMSFGVKIRTVPKEMKVRMVLSSLVFLGFIVLLLILVRNSMFKYPWGIGSYISFFLCLAIMEIFWEIYLLSPVVDNIKNQVLVCRNLRNFKFKMGIPYGIADKLKFACDKNLFDDYFVFSVDKQSDPLLVGTITNFQEYFIIGIWGNDIKERDLT